jgi:signal transduction histidine kinase
VVSNLLNNAIKFTKEGIIIITAEKKDIHVVISVKDIGTGIDPEILPRLFTRFATKSESEAGTGLGLFISKSIVEAHGGRIWAENNSPEKGATFTFSLPLSKEKKPPSPLLPVMEERLYVKWLSDQKHQNETRTRPSCLWLHQFSFL